MDQSILNYLEIGLIVLGVIGFALYFIPLCLRNSRRHNAPVETARAVAYYKHPDMEAVLTGRASTYVYYITFHTDSGDILKLYMNPQDYYSIPEGSWGMLTWQHNKFWKFEKEE